MVDSSAVQRFGVVPAGPDAHQPASRTGSSVGTFLFAADYRHQFLFGQARPIAVGREGRASHRLRLGVGDPHFPGVVDAFQVGPKFLWNYPAPNHQIVVEERQMPGAPSQKDPCGRSDLPTFVYHPSDATEIDAANPVVTQGPNQFFDLASFITLKLRRVQELGTAEISSHFTLRCIELVKGGSGTEQLLGYGTGPVAAPQNYPRTKRVTCWTNRVFLVFLGTLDTMQPTRLHPRW